MSAVVTNAGPRPAHEVAQLYVHRRVADPTQPVRELKGMKHLELAPGQSLAVAFTLKAEDLGYVHHDLKTLADPGVFDVWIAPHAEAGAPASFALSA